MVPATASVQSNLKTPRASCPHMTLILKFSKSLKQWQNTNSRKRSKSQSPDQKSIPMDIADKTSIKQQQNMVGDIKHWKHFHSSIPRDRSLAVIVSLFSPIEELWTVSCGMGPIMGRNDADISSKDASRGKANQGKSAHNLDTSTATGWLRTDRL